MRCHTGEERRYAVAQLKRIYEEYQKFRHLQTVLMHSHEILPDGRVCVQYENGECVYVDYENGTAILESF